MLHEVWSHNQEGNGEGKFMFCTINMRVYVLQREADTQAGPDGRLSGLSQHWTLALGAHETFTSTRNISQVNTRIIYITKI